MITRPARSAVNDWEPDQFNEPQLPLYALTAGQRVAAIAFACLKRGRLRFVGEAETAGLLPGVASPTELSWPERLAVWGEILTGLGARLPRRPSRRPPGHQDGLPLL